MKHLKQTNWSVDCHLSKTAIKKTIQQNISGCSAQTIRLLLAYPAHMDQFLCPPVWLTGLPKYIASCLQNPTIVSFLFLIAWLHPTIPGTFGVQILPHFVLKPTVCWCRYPSSARAFLCGIVGCWVGLVWKKSHIFVCRMVRYQKSHNRVWEKSHKKYHR